MGAQAILHLRLPHFGAAVESRLNPLLKDKCFVIASGEHDRSQLLGVSPAAAEEGLQAGMLLAHARRRAPELLVVRGSQERQRSLSDRVLALLRERTPEAERQGLSRFQIDLAGCSLLHPDPLALGRRILKELAELQLEGAIGIGGSALAASFIARRATTGEVCRLEPQEEDRLLRTFPVSWLPGVDTALRERLGEMGIHTLGEARAVAPAFLQKVFGEGGRHLVRELNRVRTDFQVRESEKRLVVERRLGRDTTDERALAAQLFELVEDAADRLRQRGRRSGYVFLELSFSDGRRLLRGEKIRRVPGQPALQGMRATAKLLLERCLEERRARVQALQLQFSRLENPDPQLDVFHAGRILRQHRVEHSLGEVKQRYGNTSVRVGLTG